MAPAVLRVATGWLRTMAAVEVVAAMVAVEAMAAVGATTIPEPRHRASTGHG